VRDWEDEMGMTATLSQLFSCGQVEEMRRNVTILATNSRIYVCILRTTIWRRPKMGWQASRHGYSAAALIVISLLSACYVPPVWDLFDVKARVDEVKEGVTTKQGVLEMFGQPDYETNNVFHYYGTTSAGEIWIGAGYQGGSVRLNERAWHLEITFDDRNIASHVILASGVRTSYMERLEERAKKGDSDAAYALSVFGNYDLNERWKWLCQAADGGSADARNTLGHHYRFGWTPVDRDLSKAYMWFTLAMQVATGDDLTHTKSVIEELLSQLTPTQISAAKLFFKDWKPGDCMREHHRASSAMPDKTNSPTHEQPAPRPPPHHSGGVQAASASRG
jgi:hypothetical protein